MCGIWVYLSPMGICLKQEMIPSSKYVEYDQDSLIIPLRWKYQSYASHTQDYYVYVCRDYFQCDI